jgi:ATP-dependent Clp protease ATP-binding subunit ClpA
MFVGPTGVGKTELAKTLTKVYFGDADFLLRLDMSEYRGGDGLQKLLGSKDDTINSPFVNHLKNHPFCLFLLDEFEKASPEILNLFLQILEDGRLTTGKGETLNLTHTIIIATSNAGTSEIQAGLTNGKALEDIKKTLSADILQKHFAPELLNRFDGIILFTPLSPAEVAQITVLQLQGLANQLLDSKGLKLSWTEQAVNDIATKGYDAALGARPIRRYVQDNVQNLLAQLILTTNPSRGTTISLDVENDTLVLK